MPGTILVVDDDRLSSAPVKQLLVSRGFEAFAVESGADALDWLRERTPDLILLDVVMPGMSGFEVCRRLRREPATRTTPVVFLTARKGLADLIEGKDAGSDLYLVKPVLAAKLLNFLDMFLGAGAPFVRQRQGA
jgi:DNA-binding response OmpR family regulator